MSSATPRYIGFSELLEILETLERQKPEAPGRVWIVDVEIEGTRRAISSVKFAPGGKIVIEGESYK